MKERDLIQAHKTIGELIRKVDKRVDELRNLRRKLRISEMTEIVSCGDMLSTYYNCQNHLVREMNKLRGVEE